MGADFPSLAFDVVDLASVAKILARVGRPATTERAKVDRRLEMLASIGLLIDADVWIWSTAIQEASLFQLPPSNILVDGNWNNPEQRKRVVSQLTVSDSFLPIVKPLIERLSDRQYCAVKTREVGVSNDTAIATACGLGDGLACIFRVNRKVYSIVHFFRSNERPRFESREFTIVDLAFSDLDWVHHMAIPTSSIASVPLSSVPPRRLQVLELLLKGDTNKEIARKLFLSPHTVGDHVKQINRQFGVTSRSELLAKFISKS